MWIAEPHISKSRKLIEVGKSEVSDEKQTSLPARHHAYRAQSPQQYSAHRATTVIQRGSLLSLCGPSSCTLTSEENLSQDSGSELCLNLQPLSQGPNPQILPALVLVRIEHVFLPLRKSQVLVVSVVPADHHTLPQFAILKFYDRRWTSDRRRRQWDFTREREARAYWEAFGNGMAGMLDFKIPKELWSVVHWEEVFRQAAEVRFILREANRLPDLILCV